MTATRSGPTGCDDCISSSLTYSSVKSDLMKKSWFALLKDSFNAWNEDKALRLSAALAYYSVFSIAPLIVITIGIAGLVLGEKAVTGQLNDQLKEYVGSQAASAVESMVQSASRPSSGIVATIVGFATLMLGASGVLGQLKDALNTIWEVKAKSGGGIMAFVRENVLNFGMVLVIGFLLMVSLLLSTFMAGLSKNFSTVMTLPPAVWAGIAFVFSFGVVTTLIALIFRILPDAKIWWRDVWLGAAITAVLFELGKTGLAWYLGLQSTSSAYGAAGSVVLLLLWVYYVSCILFFGAEFTQVYAQARGHFIIPEDHAERVTTSDRSEQGVLPAIATASESWSPHEQPAGPPPVLRHRLIDPLLNYLEGRGLLLSLEAKEALQRAAGLVVTAALAVIAVFAGWLLLITSLVGVLTIVLDWNWIKAAAVAGGCHVLLAGALGFWAWWRFGKTIWFGETLNELKKDRVWLRGTTSQH
jgi:membrane protein